jgi:hypothetical protein
VTAPAFISWVALRLSFSLFLFCWAAWFAFVLDRRKQTLPPRFPTDGQILMPPRLLLVRAVRSWTTEQEHCGDRLIT